MEHIEAFDPSSHMLKIPTAAEIRFLHLKPLTAISTFSLLWNVSGWDECIVVLGNYVKK